MHVQKNLNLLQRTNVYGEFLCPDRLDPERMAFLRNAFAEMLENTTDVFATAISRLALPEDCEANISLKERALAAITGAATFSSYAHATHTNLNLG
jgi:hypothetical protein